MANTQKINNPTVNATVNLSQEDFEKVAGGVMKRKLVRSLPLVSYVFALITMFLTFIFTFIKDEGETIIGFWNATSFNDKVEKWGNFNAMGYIATALMIISFLMLLAAVLAIRFSKFSDRKKWGRLIIESFFVNVAILYFFIIGAVRTDWYWQDSFTKLSMGGIQEVIILIALSIWFIVRVAFKTKFRNWAQKKLAKK